MHAARFYPEERENRWGNWKDTPFGPKSELHVSIYRKP
jgi:hypothetical protein